ncbi:universal stress protein [Saccharopolyspora sp. NPDC000995]
MRQVITLEKPVEALLREAQEASLLVVGSHGRGRLRRAFLGSVSHAVASRAPCPVAVLRAER